jgi:Zn ribbon nucleic-acid-binding protein
MYLVYESHDKYNIILAHLHQDLRQLLSYETAVECAVIRGSGRKITLLMVFIAQFTVMTHFQREEFVCSTIDESNKITVIRDNFSIVTECVKCFSDKNNSDSETESATNADA